MYPKKIGARLLPARLVPSETQPKVTCQSSWTRAGGASGTWRQTAGSGKACSPKVKLAGLDPPPTAPAHSTQAHVRPPAISYYGNRPVGCYSNRPFDCSPDIDPSNFLRLRVGLPPSLLGARVANPALGIQHAAAALSTHQLWQAQCSSCLVCRV